MASNKQVPSRKQIHAMQASETLAGHCFSETLFSAGSPYDWTIHLYSSPTSTQPIRSWTQEALLAEGASLAHFACEIRSLSESERALLTVKIHEAGLSSHNVLLPWLQTSKGGKSAGLSSPDLSKGKDVVQPRCALDILEDVIDKAHLIPEGGGPYGLKLAVTGLCHDLPMAFWPLQGLLLLSATPFSHIGGGCWCHLWPSGPFLPLHGRRCHLHSSS